MKKRYTLPVVSIILAVFAVGLIYLYKPKVVHAEVPNLLSPPYFGTTTVNSIFDHEFPNYNAVPPGTPPNLTTIRHNGNQELQPYPNNVYCVGYSGHDGIDYGLHYTYVRASHAGKVVAAGWSSPNHMDSFGLYVVLETTYNRIRYQTIYGHLSSILVKTQGSVTQGKIIAVSGDTGMSSGPHLHFGVKRTGDNVPPNTLYVVNPYGWKPPNEVADPWAEQGNAPPSVNLWQSFPSIEGRYCNSQQGQLPYPDGPEIPVPVSADPPLKPVITAAPFTTIIDNHNPSPRFEAIGPWTQYPCSGMPHCYGSGNTFTYHTAPDNQFIGTYAKYTPDPDELIPGEYDVYAYNPDVPSNGNARLAHYYIHHNNQTHFAGFGMYL